MTLLKTNKKKTCYRRFNKLESFPIKAAKVFLELPIKIGNQKSKNGYRELRAWLRNKIGEDLSLIPVMSYWIMRLFLNRFHVQFLWLLIKHLPPNQLVR